MRIALAALITLLASITQAEPLKKFDFPAAGSRDAPPTACAFTGLDLPAKVHVFAAGGYHGRNLDFQIDQSGHTATQFDIAVNSTDQPVVLVLGAYEPTIWNIGWTRKTNILAVFVSGYHRQAVAGLEANVPVIISTYDNRGPCGYGYVGNSDGESLNSLSRKLFNREIDQTFPGDKNGRIAIGAPVYSSSELVTSSRVTPDSFRDRNAPLAGEAGLEQAIRNGQLRAATMADLKAWKVARGEKLPAYMADSNLERDRQVLRGQYVVQKQFTFPAGLYGAHSAVFYVPRGVARPIGNPGHSSVYDYNAMGCSGPTCREFRSEASSARAAYGDNAAVAPASPGATYGAVAVARPADSGATPAMLSLDNAIESGAIRLATRADVDDWQARAAEKGYARPRTFNTYVVLKPISFPPGSSTEDAATFIVPMGIPAPQGTQGLATVFDHNSLKCTGPKCH